MENLYQEYRTKIEEFQERYRNEMEVLVRDCVFEVVVVEKKFKI